VSGWLSLSAMEDEIQEHNHLILSYLARKNAVYSHVVHLPFSGPCVCLSHGIVCEQHWTKLSDNYSCNWWKGPLQPCTETVKSFASFASPSRSPSCAQATGEQVHVYTVTPTALPSPSGPVFPPDLTLCLSWLCDSLLVPACVLSLLPRW